MFSRNARWDRHLPHESHHEKSIEVGVIFKNGKLYPRWFIWQSRKYIIKEVTYEWKDKKGDEILHCFSVSDGANLYHIHFNHKWVHWRLKKICPIE